MVAVTLKSKVFPYRNNPCISLQSHVFWQLDVTNTDKTGFNFVPNSITKQTCRLIWQQNMVHVQHRFSLCAMSSKPIGAKSTNIWFWYYIHTNTTEQSVYICSPEEVMLKLKRCTSLVDTVTKQGIIELVYMACIRRNVMFDIRSL